MYVTIDDVRALGVTIEMASDLVVTASIALACAAIDESTGQFFEPREMTMRLDGTGGNTLHVPVPIIELTELHLNGDEDDTPFEYVEIYNNLGAGRPDDRRNPRICWRGIEGIFYRGNRTQTLVGTFGFVESDLTTPILIKAAAAKLAMIYSLNPPKPEDWNNDQQNQKLNVGPIVKELTDGHYIQYSDKVGEQLAAKVTNVGLLSTDPFIQNVIRKYMRPIVVTSV